MLKKITALVISLLFVQLCFSQTENKFEKPDFDRIEKAINDKQSLFYYPGLLSRYHNDDTTITPEEYRHLYYGFSLQANYSPYGKSALNDKIRELLDKKDKTEKEIDKVIELERKLLKEFPFNLRNLNTLVNYYDIKKDTANGDIAYKKLIAVAKTILSSGDMLSDSTAAYVISVEHEYDLIGLMGYKFGGGQTLIQSRYGPVDKMKLEKNDEEIEYLYFNVTQLFASMKKTMKD
ncbi:MAG: DUF4919 domain-containing protein [Ferruginibacter sp.]